MNYNNKEKRDREGKTLILIINMMMMIFFYLLIINEGVGLV